MPAAGEREGMRWVSGEREIVQNQNSYSVARDSGTGSAGSPCLPHLPGTTEVNNASFCDGDHLLFAPAAFETERVGESESE